MLTFYKFWKCNAVSYLFKELNIPIYKTRKQWPQNDHKIGFIEMKEKKEVSASSSFLLVSFLLLNSLIKYFFNM
ncbi:MAG: hypothetical protein AB7F53_07575 [Nitrososphaeraceae archaeon]